MSRRQTPHQKREKSRNRRALDRAIIRAVLSMGWGSETSEGPQRIYANSTHELIGLAIARSRV